MAGRHPPGAGSGAVREALGIDPARRWLAVLPGAAWRKWASWRRSSRGVQAPDGAQPGSGFIVPLVNQKRREQFLAIKAEVAPELDMVLLDGQGREAMIAADVVMLASGTAP